MIRELTVVSGRILLFDFAYCTPTSVGARHQPVSESFWGAKTSVFASAPAPHPHPTASQAILIGWSGGGVELVRKLSPDAVNLRERERTQRIKKTAASPETGCRCASVGVCFLPRNPVCRFFGVRFPGQVFSSPLLCLRSGDFGFQRDTGPVT